jgi:hypothetical protein
MFARLVCPLSNFLIFPKFARKIRNSKVHRRRSQTALSSLKLFSRASFLIVHRLSRSIGPSCWLLACPFGTLTGHEAVRKFAFVGSSR